MSLVCKTLFKLLNINKFGNYKILQLLQQIPVTELVNYKHCDLKNLAWTNNQIERWFNFDEALYNQHLQWQEHAEHHIITIFDDAYPYLLKQINNPPVLLFVNGNQHILQQPQIAIVGSRQCSRYGDDCVKYFTTGLTEAGFTITSGLARGIDGLAHTYTLSQQGTTIAILGSGINYIYPKEHQQLAQQIVQQQGAIVSEFFLNTAPLAQNFPRRNRIISGLSLATLVIEASLRSGSLSTAHHALEQNRDIFTVPGTIFNHNNEGCHWLIKQGANLVETVADLLESLNLSSIYQLQNFEQYSTTLSIDNSSTTNQLDGLSTECLEVYALIGFTPIDLDSLLPQLQQPIETVLANLLILEVQGLIINQHGLYLRESSK